MMVIVLIMCFVHNLNYNASKIGIALTVCIGLVAVELGKDNLARDPLSLTVESKGRGE